MSLLGVLFVVVFIVYVIKSIIKPKNYPPGPRWYPFVGCNNIIHAKARKEGSQWKAISEISKEYGTQVLGLKMGSELVVAVYGEKNIHFVSEDLDFDARPDSFFNKLRTFGKRCGITFVDGPLWRNQRQFTVKGLRNEGFGKETMESDIQEEIYNLLNKLRNSNGKSVDITLLFSMSTANILWKYVAGENLKESKLKRFISLMDSRSKLFTMAGGWLNQWPWLRFIAPNWSGYSVVEGMNMEMFDIIQEAINKHMKKTAKGSSFMYKYLGEMLNKKQFFTEDQLRGICVDLLIASSQTTSSVLSFAIIILLRNKDIYDKIYNEINTILGKDLPHMTDCERLVYTSAFLCEIQRKFTIAPFSGPRRALKDSYIDGYYIPKGTTILTSLGDLHLDPKLWDEPDEIKPERFIDERGSLKNIKYFYPFGVGPSWYPFFGCNNIIHARTRKFGSQWKAIREIAKEYGTQVLGLKMGSELVVAVYGEKNIHFVSEDLDFDARPDSFFIKLRTFGKRSGITFVDGPLWRDQRLFTFKYLRNAGFGKGAMESDIQEEINILLNRLQNSNGNPVDISVFISIATINIVWKYVAGEHLMDDKLKKFISLMGSRSRMFTMAGGWLNQWPWLRFIAPKWSGFSIIEEINEQMIEIIQAAMFKHIEKNVEGSDFMYKYLVEMFDKKKCFTEDQLRGICMDLLIASTQTTSSVFGFAVITLLRNKDIYDIIVNEINTILGKEPPRINDYTRLVYTSAFLCEIQRKFTITPFSGPRRALKDTSIGGYCIPKGTTILISIGDLHSDPNLWDEPDKIKPERFIDECGSLKNISSFYPFGVGRRACPGRPLAKSFLFLVFVSVIQKFKIECCNGTLPSDEPILGFFAEPRPFVARYIETL